MAPAARSDTIAIDAHEGTRLAFDLSPDGRTIVFDLLGQLWLLPVEGGAARAITDAVRDTADDRDPSFAPDGSHIVFRADRPGGHGLFIVPVDGGPPRRLTTGDDRVAARTASGRPLVAHLARDQSHLAFVSPGDDGGRCLWVQRLPDGAPRRLVERCDIEGIRIRWAPDGSSVLFTADGRLWRARLDGSEPAQIPFTARVTFPRAERERLPVTFADPDEERRARGFLGLALSPDGDQIAMIALRRLWVWRPGDEPRAVAEMPMTAAGLSWSPDGAEVAWSAGPKGEDDLFATHVRSGVTRRLSSLPGREIKPAYSPDGRWLAFVHWSEDQGARVRVAPVSAGTQLSDVGQLRDLGPAPPTAPWSMSYTQEFPQWSPASDMVLVEGELFPLVGEPRSVDWSGIHPSFVRWLADGSLVFVFNNALHRGELDPETGAVGGVHGLGEGPALYPTVSASGAVLYVSSHGLRLRQPAGGVSTLDWPLRYRSTRSPGRLLIRDVRIIDGSGAPPAYGMEILIEAGRIRSIGPSGAHAVDEATRLLDAGGRSVIPGLIDLHRHTWDPVQLPASLYFGVTTVRDMGSPVAATVGLGEAIDAGMMPGPRIVVGGLSLNLPPDPASPFAGWTTEFEQRPSTVGAARAAVDLAAGFGAWVIKLRTTSNMEAALAVVDRADAHGLRVTGHDSSRLPLVAAGVDGIEHAGGAPHRQDILELTGAADFWVLSTMVGSTVVQRAEGGVDMLEATELEAFGTLWLRNRARSFSGTELSPRLVEAYRASAAAARRNLQELVEAGVRLGTGTDAPSLGWSVASLHGELEELVHAGLEPLQAIAAATGTASLILGAQDEIGTIEVGRLADLVILDADPLEDIRNTQRIWMVIQGGRVVDREALLTRGEENQ